MTQRHDQPDKNLMDLLFGEGSKAFKAEQQAEDEAAARAIVAEDGDDWEAVIASMCRATGQNSAPLIADYRANGTIPLPAIAGVLARRASGGYRPTEWEMRGSRSGE